MAGKRGLVMGVANDRSIAWGIARMLHGQGAKLAFTYQGGAFGRRAVPLAQSLGAEIIERVRRRATSPASTRCSRAIEEDLGRARLRRARARLLRPQRAAGPLRRHHARELQQHHGDLVLLLHRDRQARRRPDAERRLAAHADLWRLDAGRALLQRHGRGQGGARSLRALSRRRLRPARHPRQRAVGRADAHAGRRRHLRRARHLQLSAATRADAAHADAGRGRRRRALPAVGPVGRGHRRSAFRRLRLQRPSPCRRSKPSRRWMHEHRHAAAGQIVSREAAE